MGDTFGVEMHAPQDDPKTVWSAVRIAVKAVSDVLENRNSWHDDPWQIRHDGRSWDRPTLNELQTVAKDHNLEEFVIHWVQVDSGEALWQVRARIYKDYTGFIEVTVHAGVDRISTEAAAIAVAEKMKKRGIALEIGPTQVSSSDRRDTTSVRKPKATTAVVTKTPRTLSRLGKALANHVGALIVTVVGTVLATVIIVWLGVNPPPTP